MHRNLSDVIDLLYVERERAGKSLPILVMMRAHFINQKSLVIVTSTHTQINFPEQRKGHY